MADTITLGKRRTIRFTREDDQRLEAQAQAKKRSVSEIIRDTVRQSFHGEEMSAGDWIIAAGQTPAPPASPSPERLAFRKAYHKRNP